MSNMTVELTSAGCITQVSCHGPVILAVPSSVLSCSNLALSPNSIMITRNITTSDFSITESPL